MRKSQVIREAIAAKLEALVGLDTLPYFKKVYSSHRVVSGENLPAATVMGGGGTFDNNLNDTDVDMTVSIIIKAKGDNVQDILDSHAEKIETIFKIGETLGDLVEYMNPESFDYLIDENSTAGTMTLTYTINYEE